jgi:hypothetical protein
MASPVSGSPPLDPMPALKHATGIADEVCYISGDASLQVSYSLSFSHSLGLTKFSAGLVYPQSLSSGNIHGSR